MKTFSRMSHTPFTDWMLHPEKVPAVFKTTKSKNDAFAAARTADQSSTNRVILRALSKDNGMDKLSGHSRSELKKIKFHLAAPSATSVKLAANFTGWEKSPLDMVKSGDGSWFVFVSLSPGNYSYRFIVDGKWRNDPHSDLCELNPFGSANAVVKVT
jgi:1,4-alpha-glucan branching enzyme